jgi:transposase
MEKANHYLKKVFIPSYWKKQIMVEPDNLSCEYSLIPTKKELEEVFVIKEHRSIRNDHTFSYGNKFYLIESNLKYSIAKQRIEIKKKTDGEFEAYFSVRKLLISEVVEPTKLSLVDLEIQKKIDVIMLAEELGNISEAARRSGVSRVTIYKNKKNLKEKGREALKRTLRKDHYHKNRAEPELEHTVISFSLENPHIGQGQLSRHLKQAFDIEISPGGIRNIWLRHGMETAAKRVQMASEEGKIPLLKAS